MTEVKNLHSDGHYPPRGFSSWKEYWETKIKRKFSYCSCTSCTNVAVHGGHVKKVSGSNEWYIVPLCATHNNPGFTDSYYVNDADMLRVVD